MAHSRRGFGRQVRSQRRQTGWTPGPGDDLAAGPRLTATGKAIVGLGISIAQDGLTVIRTRGILSIGREGAVAAGDGWIGAFGIGIVFLPAFNVGITAIPGPLSRSTWEGWFVFQLFLATSSTIGSSVIENIVIDSKAARKVGEDEVIVAVVEATEIGGSALQVNFNSRLLFKLP